MRIVIAGAGSVGCFCGGLLAAGGHEVTLLGRARILDAIRARGLTLTDFSGLELRVDTSDLILSEDPASLGTAEIVIVTVKSPATAEMASEIAAHAPAEATVLSWQNGMGNTSILRAALPGRDVRAGMVPFNVVSNGPASFHRASSGEVVIEAGGGLADRVSVPHLPVRSSRRIEAVQWGKLLLNLNNALNALSGLPLQQQLGDRAWRRLMADQMAEALNVLRTAGIRPLPPTPLPARWIPLVLRLPDPLFVRVAARMLTIDPKAMTSMAYDLAEGRKTEIDDLQGEILRLAGRHGVVAPLCARVSELVDAATATAEGCPGLLPADIRPR